MKLNKEILKHTLFLIMINRKEKLKATFIMYVKLMMIEKFYELIFESNLISVTVSWHSNISNHTKWMKYCRNHSRVCLPNRMSCLLSFDIWVCSLFVCLFCKNQYFTWLLVVDMSEPWLRSCDGRRCVVEKFDQFWKQSWFGSMP